MPCVARVVRSVVFERMRRCQGSACLAEVVISPTTNRASVSADNKGNAFTRIATLVLALAHPLPDSCARMSVWIPSRAVSPSGTTRSTTRGTTCRRASSLFFLGCDRAGWLFARLGGPRVLLQNVACRPGGGNNARSEDRERERYIYI